MSTEYFIGCRVCEHQECGSISGGLGKDYMVQCLAARDRIPALLDLVNEFDLEIKHDWMTINDGEHPIVFISRHQGHDLVVMDEYGYIYDPQGERVTPAPS